MKVKILGTKMLSQCPVCTAIKMETKNKYQPFVWQSTFVEFPKLPKETCLACLRKLQ